MKKRRPVFTESELLAKYPIRSNIDGWYFSIEQVAVLTWYIKAKSVYGFEISTSGTDEPETLVEQCESAIRKESLTTGMYFIS